MRGTSGYYFLGGSYEALVEGIPGQIGTFRRITPVPPPQSIVGYAHPAFSPDGARIAAARCDSTCVVVLGRPGSALRELWRPMSPRFVDVRDLAWLDETTLLVAIGRPTSRVSNLFRLSIARPHPEAVVFGIASFAVSRG